MGNGASDADKSDLREIALDGMEECPAYFGAFPPPTMTPYEHTARYKTLMNDVFWIHWMISLTPEAGTNFLRF